jgi:RNA polymerase sigma-70 factor (ECF subfamily)
MTRVATLGFGAHVPRHANTLVPREQLVTASPESASAAADRALVERMAAGDDRALGALYDRHGRTAYALALAIVREPADAEEVVVDVFGQAWRTAGAFDSARGSAVAWLTTIVRSRSLDLVRSRGRRARAHERAASLSGGELATPIAAAGEDPGRGVEQSETRRLVARSLAELPEAQRRVIELAYFEGLSQSEIAERLTEPLGTVKTRMRAGMEKLRGLLAPLLLERAS